MLDFIIATIVSLIVNAYIAPYWEIIKIHYEQLGYDFTIQYNMLLAASYLAVGTVAYLIIKFLKWLFKKLN